MPTRRILEVAVVTVVLMRPVFGLVRLWSSKTLLQTQNGTFQHGLAEVMAVAL